MKKQTTTTLGPTLGPTLGHCLVAFLLLTFCPSVSVQVAFAQESLHELKTVAEASHYRATASGADTELFLKRLQRLWPEASLESIGKSVEGRTIWGLVVEPEPSGIESPLTVLLLGGIHSGECDGKEALLALARDFAAGKHKSSRQHLRLVFVPNFNADGNDRVGKLHRPGQVGPEAGMGVRENAQGLDLNRDFVKLETPEVRALIAAMNRYDVDVLIDTHTTNGSLHRYDLTYAVSNNPAAPRSLDRWLRSELLPTVTRKLDEAGIATFYYGNFENEHQTWKTFGHEPRYSIELMGLRGKIGILAESYSYASYQRRIEATYRFVNELLSQISGQRNALRGLLSEAEKENQPGDPLPIKAALTETGRGAVRGFQKAEGTLPKGPYDAKSSSNYQEHDYNVELWMAARATQATKLPNAYALSESYAWALSRLQLHGVLIERLNDSTGEVPCEVATIVAIEKGIELQNHALRQLTVRHLAQQQSLERGCYIVRTAQPLGTLAGYLMEAESDDGLAAWNFFDPDLAVDAEYPVVRVLADIPADKLTTVTTIARTEPLTFEHIMQPRRTVEYSTSSSSGAAWMEGSNELVIKQQRGWEYVDPSSGAMRPCDLLKRMEVGFASLDAFKSVNLSQRISPGILSSDARYGMLSQSDDVFLFDDRANVARQLTHSPKKAEELAELSPTGEHIAFVRENDLYVVNCQSTEERRLTHDGSTERLNGILDWVYQEEVYGRGQFRAFWFSPNGQRLAFLQLDQTPVLHYRVPDSIHYRQELEDTRYPKAGDPLPIARMWIADIASGQLREVDLSAFPADDRLVVRVKWSPKNELWLQIQNRIQTQQTILRVDAASGLSSRVLEEKSPGWIEVLGQPKFLNDGDFLWLSDLPDGRRHLSRFDVQSNKLVRLTKGEWDIADLVAVSPDGGKAYVTGNILSPIESHLVSVDTESGQTQVVTPEPGVHRVRMSPDCQFLIDTWSNLATPPKTLLRRFDGAIQRVLSAPISDRHAYLKVASPRLLTIPARDGQKMQAMLLLPPESDETPTGSKKLPVLFHVYGGPQAPTVHNQWQVGNYWWHQYLCSRGFAVVLCDNRASRGQGIADTWKIHRDMGRVELNDLEDAAAWVAAQTWADGDRMGVWGWSYGGYLSAYTLTHSHLFRAGIAGAPVTDWHNYDAIYTERYMDLPKNNPDGYKSSSVVTAAAQLHGRLLLIHGERDDNVHLSNTLQLAYALQKVNKPFDMMIYPKNRHGIAEPSQRYHLYQTMTEFLERHLK